MIIGILQAGHAPDELRIELGDFSDLFQHLLGDFGFRFATYNVVDMAFPFSPLECDGWLITGSRHGAYEDLPFIAPLEELIRGIYGTGRPLVGICFGHQIIAQALGGKVEKFKGGWSVGRQDYDWNGDALALNAWHQDQVVKKPKDAKVIATNGHCENAALLYGNRAFTIQPHPEFDAHFIAQLAEHRGPGVVPEDQLIAAKETLSLPTANATIASQIAQFFKNRSLA